MLLALQVPNHRIRVYPRPQAARGAVKAVVLPDDALLQQAFPDLQDPSVDQVLRAFGVVHGDVGEGLEQVVEDKQEVRIICSVLDLRVRQLVGAPVAPGAAGGLLRLVTEVLAQRLQPLLGKPLAPGHHRQVPNIRRIEVEGSPNLLLVNVAVPDAHLGTSLALQRLDHGLRQPIASVVGSDEQGRSVVGKLHERYRIVMVRVPVRLPFHIPAERQTRLRPVHQPLPALELFGEPSDGGEVHDVDSAFEPVEVGFVCVPGLNDKVPAHCRKKRREGPWTS